MKIPDLAGCYTLTIFHPQARSKMEEMRPKTPCITSRVYKTSDLEHISTRGAPRIHKVVKFMESNHLNYTKLEEK